MPLETVESLIQDLKAEGLDAKISYKEEPGGGASGWEAVFVWVGQELLTPAVRDAIVGYFLLWAGKRFSESPEDKRPKALHIHVHDGDKGRVGEIVEKESEDAEPIVRYPESFEGWTTKKPEEGVKRWSPKDQ